MATTLAAAPKRRSGTALTVLLHLALFLFVWVSVVGLNPLTDRNSSDYDMYAMVGSQQYIGFYAGCLLMAGVALATYNTMLFRLFDLSLVLLFAWATLTLTVSVRPLPASIDVVKQFAFMLGVASFLVLYRSDVRLLAALKVILLVIVVADVLAVLAVPSLAIHQTNDVMEQNLAGAWRGLHEHKGKFGELLSVTALLHFYDWRPNGRAWNLAVALACVALLLPSGSKISLAGLMITILAVEFVVWWARYAHGLLLSALLLPIVAALVIVMSYLLPIILEAVFGDTTLTGRTFTWAFLWQYVQEHPLMGSGFASFFIGDDGPLAQSGDPFLMRIGHAHNSYLDLLVNMGWPGLFLGVLAFVVVPVARCYSRLPIDPIMRVWLSLVVFAAVASVTSIAFFQPQRALGLGLTLGIFGIRWATRRTRATGRLTYT